MAAAPPDPQQSVAQPVRPHLIALDIDGTTVGHDGSLSDPVEAAVSRVRADGHQVVIATGRSITATLGVLDQLGLVGGFAICSNGAVTLRLDPTLPGGYAVHECVTFDPAPAVTLVRDACPGAHIAVEHIVDGRASFKVNAPFPNNDEVTPEVVGWDDLIGSPTSRVTMYDPEGTSQDFQEMTERIGLHGVNYAIGYSAWMDITPEGVSKASALEQVRRLLHIEPGDTVAVGDQRNDLEMLRWAARGVAMGGSPPEVVEAADEVTGAVEQDGLAAVLESIPAVTIVPSP